MTLRLTPTLLARSDEGPILVVGPSLGTSVRALWSDTAALLAGEATVIGWDLPGHGETPDTRGDFSVADLGAAVARLVATLRSSGDLRDGPVVGAGVSLGGAVTLQAALDHPDLFAGVVALCTSARIGEPSGWLERADSVAAAGTPTMVAGSAQRWFAPGFVERAPHVVTRLLRSLQDADRFGYARCCRALAGYDVRERLDTLGVPLLVVAGEQDAVCPPDDGALLAERAPHGTLHVLAGVAHLAPAEAPAEVAALLRGAMTLAPAAALPPAPAVPDVPPAPAVPDAAPVPVVPAVPAVRPTATAAPVPAAPVPAGGVPGAGIPAAGVPDPYEAGMAVRRAVLGDAHVDRATAAADDLSADFQALITRYAWGSIWTRPGLDRVTRSAITLTALIAGDHWDELRLHVHAALRNGMTRDQLREVLLQSAIYCSVPSANTAFRIAREELARAED
jgi:3-oxoadipate enol-lactonase/4-carboxymuconolactone decarboxylase